MIVWLTIDGERKGPHALHPTTAGSYLLSPMDDEWLALTPIEDLANMGIVEMRLK